MPKKIVLIDGHSILHRAFYGIPDLTNAEGLHTNAVYGFLNIMFKILEEEKPEYLTVAFDVHHPTFRHELFSEYKGTRKPMPEELREQIPVLKDVLAAMQIKLYEKPGYEADDILGTLARKAETSGMEVALISGDRDLLQLATDHIKIRIPKTKRGGTEIEDYLREDVLRVYGVTPEQIVDLKGLMGDTADNIPGVPGIGEKRATAIVAAFGSIEGAMEHIDEVKPPKARENLKEYYDQAKLSKKLAAINTETPLEFLPEEARIQDFYTKEAYALIKKLEFKNILARFSSDLGRDAVIEETFQKICSQKDAESFWKQMEKERKGAVGLCLLRKDSVKKEPFLTETDGQLSFFSGEFSETEGKEKLKEANGSQALLGLGISYQSRRDGEIKSAGLYASGNLDIAWIRQRLLQLKEEGTEIAMLNLKEQLTDLPFEEKDPVYDLSIAAYLINPLKDTYLYPDIARDYLGLQLPGYSELLGKTKKEDAFLEALDQLHRTVCYESYTACLAKEPLFERLRKEEELELYLSMEMPLVYTLYEMEQRGILVHKEALQEYGEQLVGRISQLEQDIYACAGEVFNINSPKQLGVILFDKMHLPFGKKTKTGYSTSAEVLEKLRLEDPIIELILEYRQLTKLKSTYADGLASYIHPADHRIHSRFHQTITATGRISSADPNLQNIPIRMELGRRIRKVFIPMEDYVFLDADYSQIELRVLAHMSGDEKLIEAYGQAQDIHRLTASEVFHTPFDEVTDLERRKAKAVNFGIVYGISAFGLSQDLHISRKEAEDYIKKYFDTYPEVKAFLDSLVEMGKTKGYVSTIYHRKRPIPELVSGNYMQRSFGERVAMNSPIQGTAADIIKIAMLRVNRRLKKEGLKSRLLLQIHDELLVETHKSEIETVKAIMTEEMQEAAKLRVRLEVDIHQGANWYEAK